jgi:hypothetical protein
VAEEVNETTPPEQIRRLIEPYASASEVAKSLSKQHFQATEPATAMSKFALESAGVKTAAESIRKLSEVWSASYIEPIQRMHETFLRSYIEPIEGIRKAYVDQVIRPMEAITKQIMLPSEQLRQITESINASFAPIQGMFGSVLRDLQPILKQFQEQWLAALPPNWREFEFEDVEAALTFMAETGWCIAWSPRRKIVQTLLAADDRSSALLAEAHLVLDDAAAVADGITEPQLADLVEALREAIDCWRDGRFRAAQATANVAFTDVLHCHLGFRGLGAFKKAHEHFEAIDPLEAAIAEMRYWAILRAAKHALVRFMGDEGEPVPSNYSRHASAHTVTAEQYTPENGLVAILLVTGLLSELAYWYGQAAEPELPRSQSVAVSS